MKIAVVSDFDGTITERDVGDMLLLEFGKATLQEIEESYKMGINVEQWMKVYFSRMKDVSLDDIERIINEKVKARDGFKEALKFFSQNNIPFEVVSGGVDLYIDAFMKKYGVSFNGFYGRFGNGDISYDFLNGMTLSEFKASRVINYRNLGYTVVFLGDSQNDYKAILAADIRFATLNLEKILLKEKKEFIPYSTFEQVRRFISEALSF